jgi:hypothetical protein
LVALGGARTKARDAKRQSDVRQIVTAQEMYNGEFGYYFSSATGSGFPAISPYIPILADSTTATNYRWIANTTCNSHFCAYAILENRGTCAKGKIMVATESGAKEVCINADTTSPYTPAEPATGCSCDTQAW